MLSLPEYLAPIYLLGNRWYWSHELYFEKRPREHQKIPQAVTLFSYFACSLWVAKKASVAFLVDGRYIKHLFYYLCRHH